MSASGRLIQFAASASLLLLLATTGCVQVGSSPYPPIPPPRAEVMAKPPVTETLLIWQPGHWEWIGSGYEWMPGAYVARVGHSDLWMQGYWDKTDQGWSWRPAHWVP